MRQNVRIMTYNIASASNNHNPRTRDFDAAPDVIRALNPDVCALNEVGNSLPAHIASHAEYIAQRCGMHVYFARAINTGKNGEFVYGNALLSKNPILNTRTVMIPDPEDRSEDAAYETRCLLVGETEIGGRMTTVLVTHFGLAKSERLNAAATVCGTLDMTDGPVLLMGDFNLTPDDPTLTPVYERLDECCGERSNVAKNKALYTFSSDKPYEKIDYIFASGHFGSPKVSIPRTLASDHMPLVSDYQII